MHFTSASGVSNSFVGEMEQTALHAFIHSARLKLWFAHADCSLPFQHARNYLTSMSNLAMLNHPTASLYARKGQLLHVPQVTSFHWSPNHMWFYMCDTHLAVLFLVAIQCIWAIVSLYFIHQEVFNCSQFQEASSIFLSMLAMCTLQYNGNFLVSTEQTHFTTTHTSQHNCTHVVWQTHLR